MMALVRQGTAGAVYESSGPIIPNRRPPIVTSAAGGLTSLESKSGERLEEVQEGVVVQLESEQADRYSSDSTYWGSLPAWCAKCRTEAWIDVGDLRRGGPDLLI